VADHPSGTPCQRLFCRRYYTVASLRGPCVSPVLNKLANFSDQNHSIVVGDTPNAGRVLPSLERPIQRADKTSSDLMKILLYNPDNGVTGNFMPHHRHGVAGPCQPGECKQELQ